MKTSNIYIRPKSPFDIEKAYAIQLFLSDWLEDVCKDDYTLEEGRSYGTWTIKFDSSEDAVIVKLSDLPTEFNKYIGFY